MQRRLLDILADPDNPSNWPLKLDIFKSEEKERKILPHPHENGLLCKFYCHLKDQFLVSDPLGEEEKPLDEEKLLKITTIDECFQCIKLEIVDGMLYHNNDDEIKWFMIDREIPVMYPIELRDISQEQLFISNFKEQCENLGIKSPNKDN
ncbi:MAG: hypothetical protein HeimC2_43020 [Candidatus Heimdallarchaeota archaeon LC_2]|nr:MAG: hypothetical protein HeimC2_43020 [Candidatus Heimdallarchaeota archaeon LC_2]